MRRIPDLDNLLNSENTNETIIFIDTFVSEHSSHGENLENLTEAQRNFFFNQALEIEVNNGGFYQYLANLAGAFAHETVISLQIIGATKTAKLLQEAINEFPNAQVPRDRTERVGILIDIGDDAANAWEKLDNEFYKYEDDLNLLNLRYIRENRSEF